VHVWRRLLSPLAGVALAVPCGVAVAHAVNAGTSPASSPVDAAEIAAGVSEQPTPISENVPAHDPGSGGAGIPWPPHVSESPEGYTSLADCPEALAFLERAEVVAFYSEHFGRPLRATDWYAGPCPEVSRLQRDYENAQRRVGEGQVGVPSPH